MALHYNFLKAKVNSLKSIQDPDSPAEIFRGLAKLRAQILVGFAHEPAYVIQVPKRCLLDEVLWDKVADKLRSHGREKLCAKVVNSYVEEQDEYSNS